MNLLVTSIDPKKVFGTIAPPPGSGFSKTGGIGGSIGTILVRGIQYVLIIAAVMTLIYLFWGGFDWISGGGDKEKIAKAQMKIRNALIGIFIIVASLALFELVTGDILKIIQLTPSGWQFNLPTL